MNENEQGKQAEELKEQPQAAGEPEVQPEDRECCRKGEACEVHEHEREYCEHEGCKGKEEGQEHGKHCRHEHLKEELAKAQAAAADYKDKWMRSAAEFDNFRKRNEATRRNAYLDGKADILVKVLPVGDNLELALRSCADEQTKKGIEMVLRSFKKLLEDEGIEEIDPKDEEFDPALCEAVMSEPAAEGVEPGYVIEVFRKGYRKGEKVIRYAQVKVTT